MTTTGRSSSRGRHDPSHAARRQRDAGLERGRTITKGIAGEDINDLNGLMQKSPSHALWMLIFLLSLAGIPPTAGMWGKYYIFLALIQTGHYTLAVIATLYVAVAIYYYFKIVRSMFTREETEPAPLATSLGLRLALGATGFFTLALGVYPQPLLWLAQTSLLRLR